MSTIDALRRRALEDGEELVIDGRPFNAGRERMALTKPAPIKPEPVEQPAPDLSAIVREVAELSQSRDAQTAQAQQAQTQRLVEAITGAMRQPAPPQEAKRPTRWTLKVNYQERGGAIDSIDMTPAYD